jgi:hypothetical protein
MEVNKTLINALNKEDCLYILEDVNKELNNYKTSHEQILNISNLCLMVRARLDYLRLLEKDNGRFLSKVTREKIEEMSIDTRKELSKKLVELQDFNTRCVIDYINQINYEQEQ